MEPTQVETAKSEQPLSEAEPDPLAFLLDTNAAAAESAAGVGILDLQVDVPKPESTRSTLDLIALALAIVVAPLGLAAGIVASVRSSRRLGYVSGLARAAIVVAIVLCLILAGGGVVYSFYASNQARQAALRAGSKPMCAIIAKKPGVLKDPAFGWPALTSTIPAYVEAVGSYVTWWDSIEAAAPKQIRSQVAEVAAAAKSNADRMAVSKVVEHDQDYADLQKVASASTLPLWVHSYCR